MERVLPRTPRSAESLNVGLLPLYLYPSRQSRDSRTLGQNEKSEWKGELEMLLLF